LPPHEAGGYEALPILVRFAGTEIPAGECIGLVLLDYRLNSIKTSPEFAQEIRSLYPTVPIIVRKGEPARLLETISPLFRSPSRAFD
jgi:hypothetical protein